MARQQRDFRLQTRDARRKLERAKEPYWHEVRRGLHLGYYKGALGGSWCLRERRGGRYYKRDLGVADDTVDADGDAVLSWEQALQLALGDARPTATAMDAYTVADALEAYWDARRAKSPPSSLATDRAKADAHIPARLAARDVNELTSAELRQWFDERVKASADPEAMRRSQDSANRVWSILRAALNFAYASGHAKGADAWRRIRPFRNVDRARMRVLSVAEVKRVLNAMEPDFRSLARGSLYTGLRLGELLALQVRDVEATRVHVRHSKSGKARTVPLNAEGAGFFEEVSAGRADDAPLFVKATGQPWQRIEITRRMAKASAAANLKPPARFHDLRRTYASLLINKGTDAEIIRELLGHADLRMTLRAYAHLLNRTVAKAVKKNLPGMGFKRSNVRKLRP